MSKLPSKLSVLRYWRTYWKISGSRSKNKVRTYEDLAELLDCFSSEEQD